MIHPALRSCRTPQRETPMKDHYLLFAFVGCERPWRVLGEGGPREETVVAMRAVPGNLVVTADTYEEATSKLQSLIERAIDRAASPEDWYDKASEKITSDDRKVLADCVAAGFRRARRLGTLHNAVFVGGEAELSVAG